MWTLGTGSSHIRANEQLSSFTTKGVCVCMSVCVSPEDGLFAQNILKLNLTDFVKSSEVILRTEVCWRRSTEDHVKGGGWEVQLTHTHHSAY